jgi:DNA-directed RNA polymerase subunit E'
MFKVVEVEDSVRVPPEKFEKELEDSIGESIQESFEGVFSSELGIVLNLESVEEVGEGKVVPEDGGVYYPVKFKLLIFLPEEYEVTLGEVVDITEFGAFVRIGPVDAMTHISQIMNDYVSYDKKNSILVGRDKKNVLKEGDLIRARIISISFTKDNRVGLTMRQPGLGALKWLVDKEKKAPQTQATSQPKKEEKAEAKKKPRPKEAEPEPPKEAPEKKEESGKGEKK